MAVIEYDGYKQKLRAMDDTIDNLYNIKRRALERLRQNYLIDYLV